MEKHLETPHGRFTFRPYRPEDEQGVLELWREAFGREMDTAVWRWKYLDGPFGHRIVLCLDEEGRVVVAYPGVPYPFTCQGRTIRVIQPMDSMSHPQYRGTISGRKGLYAHAVEHYFDLYGGDEEALCMYGFPGARHYRLGNRLLGYTLLSRQAAYLRATTPRLPWPCFSRIRVERWTPELGLGLFDVLFSEIAPHYPMALVRNKAFITWRFFEHPLRSYQLWLARTAKGRVAGYAAVNMDGNVGRIVDVLLPDDPPLVKGFAARLRGALRLEAGTLETWLPEKHFLARGFCAAGFRQTQEPLGIRVVRRIFSPALDEAYVDANLFYTMADGDLF